MYGFPDGVTTPEVSVALTLTVIVTRPELILIVNVELGLAPVTHFQPPEGSL